MLTWEAVLKWDIELLVLPPNTVSVYVPVGSYNYMDQMGGGGDDSDNTMVSLKPYVVCFGYILHCDQLFSTQQTVLNSTARR